MLYILPYVLNGPIYLILYEILRFSVQADILYDTSTLEDLLQICRFIEDIILCVLANLSIRLII